MPGSSTALFSFGNTSAVSLGGFTTASTTGATFGLLEAKRMKDWTFVLSGSITGGGITIQGGILIPSTTYTPGIPSSATLIWFNLPAPAEQAGTGVVVNPLTASDGTQCMLFKGTIWAVRAVSNATFATAGTCTVYASATP